MRGEEDESGTAALQAFGSPPHARGRVECLPVRPRAVRITPACAGKSRPTAARPTAAPDHPRMRGEEEAIVSEVKNSGGSPPHARGRDDRACPSGLHRRITPACAGKSKTVLVKIHYPTDHPRMRGEEGTPITHHYYHSGSPPHARGRGASQRRPVFEIRITPACAGKRPE